MTMHLWEAGHSYFCNEGSYEGSDNSERFASWEEFAAEYIDDATDFDYNLLFRWDWHFLDDADTEPGADPSYRTGILKLFWVAQRKGLYRYTLVSVCAADEPAVRAWLQRPFEHLLALWAPLEMS